MDAGPWYGVVFSLYAGAAADVATLFDD